MDSRHGGEIEAMILSSMHRSNPILMTTLTTGLALIPLVMAANKPGSEFRSPKVIVVLSFRPMYELGSKRG
jgi:Cu(I)/Ag(I) efflux system membrane protein CusA/SilA